MTTLLEAPVCPLTAEEITDTICNSDNYVGAGSSRTVYATPNKKWVVKVNRDTSTFGDQNAQEYENVMRLLNEPSLPKQIRIPQCFYWGGMIIQEFVEGTPLFCSKWGCFCDQPECLGVLAEQVNHDCSGDNVRIRDGQAWLIDLGYVKENDSNAS